MPSFYDLHLVLDTISLDFLLHHPFVYYPFSLLIKYDTQPVLYCWLPTISGEGLQEQTYDILILSGGSLARNRNVMSRETWVLEFFHRLHIGGLQLWSLCSNILPP